MSEARSSVKLILATIEINAKSLFCQPFSAKRAEAEIKIDTIILDNFNNLQCNFETVYPKKKLLNFIVMKMLHYENHFHSRIQNTHALLCISCFQK